MSSNRPPQLHLALPTNTTSFKRSFEQFGFDLESPVSQAEPGSSGSSGTLGSNDGNERNKRQRSDSSLSRAGESSSGSSQLSDDADNSTEGTLTSGGEDIEAPSIPADPPRLPTPELEDVEMPYYTPTDPVPQTDIPAPQPPPRHNEQYRAILERFNEFDSEINVLRVGLPEASLSPRSPSPPPTLPPLELPISEPDLNTESSFIRHQSDRIEVARPGPSYTTTPPAPSPPRIEFAPPITPPLFWRSLNPTDEGAPDTHTFQQRLDQALDALRSAPPLDVVAMDTYIRPLDEHHLGSWPSRVVERQPPQSSEAVHNENQTQLRHSRMHLPAANEGSDRHRLWRHIVDRNSADFAERPPRLSTEIDQLSPFRLSFDEDEILNRVNRLRDSRTHRASAVERDHISGPSSRWTSVIPGSSEDPDADVEVHSLSRGPRASLPQASDPHISSAVHRLRHRRPTAPSNSNSLVSENAAAMRRDLARTEMLNSIGANSMSSVSSPTGALDDIPFLFLPSHHTASPSASSRPPRRSSLRSLHSLQSSGSSSSSSSPFSHPARDFTLPLETQDPLLDFARESSPPASLYRSSTASTRSTRSEDLRASERVFETMMRRETLRRRAAEEERLNREPSPPGLVNPISPGLTHLVPGPTGNTSSQEPPPSLPSPDLGPILTPIDIDEHETVYDISRRSSSPPPRRPSPRAFPLDPRTGTGITRGMSIRRTAEHARNADISMNDTRGSSSSSESLTGNVGPGPPRRHPMFRDMNPDDYRPGRFRSTIQQLVEMDRTRNESLAQSSPPSLPPLGFDWERETSRSWFNHSEAMLSTSMVDAERRYHRSLVDHHDEEYIWRFPGLNPSQDESPTTPSWSNGAWGARQRLAPSATRHNHGSVNTINRPDPDRRHNRSSSDVHEYLVNRPRIEASRLAVGPQPTPRRERDLDHLSTPGAAEGLSRAIEVMRHDGLSSARSQQLIDQFQREREQMRNNLEPSLASSTMEESRFGAISDDSMESSSGRAWRRTRAIPRRQDSSSSFTADPSGSPTEFPSGMSSSRAARDGLQAIPPSRRWRNTRGRIPPNAMGFMFGSSVFQEFARYPRRSRPLGDYMRDEDFDSSYEGLLNLAATLGDVKSKSTPGHVIASLPTGFYKDWATADSDHRCPICLDDYRSLDPVLKLPECNHWLHKECLEQWLRGASTCPVCRQPVKAARAFLSQCPRHRREHSIPIPESEVGSSRPGNNNPNDGDGPSFLQRARSAWTVVRDSERANASSSTGTDTPRRNLFPSRIAISPEPNPHRLREMSGPRGDPTSEFNNTHHAPPPRLWDTYRSTAGNRTRPAPSWSAFPYSPSTGENDGSQERSNDDITPESPIQPRDSRSRPGESSGVDRFYGFGSPRTHWR